RKTPGLPQRSKGPFQSTYARIPSSMEVMAIVPQTAKSMRRGAFWRTRGKRCAGVFQRTAARGLAFRHACDILFRKTTARRPATVARQPGRKGRQRGKKAVRKERFAMAVWNPKIECAKRSDIEAIQLERLKWSVQHA